MRGRSADAAQFQFWSNVSARWAGLTALLYVWFFSPQGGTHATPTGAAEGTRNSLTQLHLDGKLKQAQKSESLLNGLRWMKAADRKQWLQDYQKQTLWWELQQERRTQNNLHFENISTSRRQHQETAVAFTALSVIVFIVTFFLQVLYINPLTAWRQITESAAASGTEVGLENIFYYFEVIFESSTWSKTSGLKVLYCKYQVPVA